MSRLGFTTLVATALAVSACSKPQPDIDNVESCIKDAMLQTGLTGGIAIFGRPVNELVVTDGVRAKVEVLLSTPRAAASLTKPVVAAEIRRLLAAGTLQLDTPITNVLDDRHMPAGWNTATIGHLLTHSAGMPANEARDPLWQPNQEGELQPNCRRALRFMYDTYESLTPQAGTVYSNIDYCLLGEVVEKYATEPQIIAALHSPLGGAGGWRSTPRSLYQRLSSTLPLEHIDLSRSNLPDGSHYDYAWRHWPQEHGVAQWTHYGRLPGLVTMAFTDGNDKLLIAMFYGDPADYQSVGNSFNRNAWPCLDPRP